MEEQQEPDDLAPLAPGSRRMRPGARVRIGIGAGLVLLIAAFAIAVAVSALAPQGSTRTVTAVTGAARATAGGDTAGTDRARASGGTPTPAALLFVHVAGAVKHPGLYQVHAGARVVDAVAAAGGFAAGAEKAGVNLARPVSDGEQLVVPKEGEAPRGASAAGGATAGIPDGGTININTATTEQLEQLPRIGPAMAQRIVEWRETNGRFTTIDDLMSVTGIGQKTFDGLKDRVTV